MKKISLVCLLVVASLLIAACGSSNKEANKAPANAKKSFAKVTKEAVALGCTVQTPPDAGFEHMGEGENKSLTTHPAYTSDPPSSGWHFGMTGAWGYYDKPLQDGYMIHNMEHGGVIIFYPTGADKYNLKGLVHQGKKVVVTPRDNFTGVDATAWDKLLTCKNADTIGTTKLTKLLNDWITATMSTGRDGEKDLPAVIAGTRQSINADASDPSHILYQLPAPPKPLIDTTEGGDSAQFHHM